MITLGIGHDIAAEQRLKAVVSENCRFFGADPIAEINKDLYEQIGKYYEMAIGAASEVRPASVLGCKFCSSFLNGSLGISVIHRQFPRLILAFL